jgi:hypothetical protein
MGVFGSVVEPLVLTMLVLTMLVLTMLDARQNRLLRRPIGAQLVRDHDPRGPALLLQQLAQQPLGRLGVAPASVMGP